MALKGIIAHVYRSKLTGCAGISDRVDEIVIVGAGIDEIFEATPTRPAFKLTSHMRGVVTLVPVDAPKGMIGPMMGGNFANTSDSRVGRAVEKLLGQSFYGAIAIHDRFETQAQYDTLSR